jgi:cysteinyl-tRNA synthetase
MKQINVHNNLSKQLEPLQTIEVDRILMYCCGITVYDYCHVGHARTCLVWDVVRRYLQWRGYRVKYIQNFTDIDDKILNKARQEGTTMEEVSERFIAAYFEDMERLGIRPADAYPRATHALDGIKKLVFELEQKGFAYPAEGDVYYAVRQFEDYGKLSGRKLEDMEAGRSGRVEIDSEEAKKKDPFDFALWKAAKEGEPFWDSSWGKGRPGWHIECSAMVREHLGESIDIHVGGSDLIFPHHENEIAQSEAVTGQPLARYWLHNGMIKINGEKMSKSLGNFITIRDLLDRPVEAMAVRLFILQAHYSKPVDFTDEALAAATNGWQTLREGLLFGSRYGERLGWQDNSECEHISANLRERFRDLVDEDFNFAGGLAILFEIAKELRKEGNLLVHEDKTEGKIEELRQKWLTLVDLADILGFNAELEAENTIDRDGLSDAEIESLIQQRMEARKNKDFATGDRIRDELKSQGIILIDRAGGVTNWIRE